jgi:hypothetical protein
LGQQLQRMDGAYGEWLAMPRVTPPAGPELGGSLAGIRASSGSSGSEGGSDSSGSDDWPEPTNHHRLLVFAGPAGSGKTAWAARAAGLAPSAAVEGQGEAEAWPQQRPAACLVCDPREPSTLDPLR